MADSIGTLRIDSSSQGILGKRIVMAILERRRARREAKGAVHAKNEVPRLYSLVKEDGEKHRLNDYRQHVTEFIQWLHLGLQESHDVKTLVQLVLKEMLLKDPEFFKNYGGNISEQDLRAYRQYIEDIKTTLKQCSEYINGIVKAGQGQITPILGKIDREAEKYEYLGLVSTLIGRPLESFHERRLAKSIFKVEHKIEKEESHLEKMGHSSSLHELLKLNKEFASEFREIMKTMFIYDYILVKNGARCMKDIQHAASENVLNVPPSFKREFADSIYELLESEHLALDSTEKAINQLYELLGKTERALDESLSRAKKGELVRA